MTITTLGTAAASFRHHSLSCFAAGFISVLVFQMGAWAIMYALGMTPNAPLGYAPTKPFGVPQIWSFAFWGGVWGLIFGSVERWFPEGPVYYVAVLPVRRDRSGSRALVRRLPAQRRTRRRRMEPDDHALPCHHARMLRPRHRAAADLSRRPAADAPGLESLSRKELHARCARMRPDTALDAATSAIVIF